MNTLRTAFFVAILASAASAQTTGVPGLNDFTINGSGSGSTSAQTVTVPAAPDVALVLEVDTDADIVHFEFAFGPAVPGFAALPDAGCGPTTYDLDTAQALFRLTLSSFGGQFPPIPLVADFTEAMGMSLSVQAFVFGTSCSTTNMPTATQAYTVQIN